MRHQDMQAKKLVDYALQIDIGAVKRRLGYLLELYALAPESELDRLRKKLTDTYLPLDPVLPREGLTCADGVCNSISRQTNSRWSGRPE
jgi:predicted transcriptional regulator of viral defense system